MAGKTREIKGRIKAVNNIQRITKTMQMISTARFQAMQRRATSAQAYTRKISEVVGELAEALAGDDSGGSMGVVSPLLKPPAEPTGEELVLVITSNRGLCGGYNANVLRTLRQFLKDRDEVRMNVEVVGKKGRAFCRFNQIALSVFHSQITDTPAYEEVERLAMRYMAEYTAGRYDAVRVIAMAFESMARQRPRIMQLLPLENPVDDNEAGIVKAIAQYDFSPPPAELLNELLPVTVKTTLFQCFNEAVVSEQLARMVAMKAATDAAGKMRKTLVRDFNRARQTAITTELTEIIGGAAALG